MDKLLIFFLGIGIIIAAILWQIRWMISYDRKERRQFRALAASRGWRIAPTMPTETLRAIDMDIVGGLQSQGSFSPMLTFESNNAGHSSDIGFAIYDPPAFTGIAHCRTMFMFLVVQSSAECIAWRKNHKTTADHRFELLEEVSIENEVWSVSGSSMQSIDVALRLVRFIETNSSESFQIREFGMRSNGFVATVGWFPRDQSKWDDILKQAESIGQAVCGELVKPGGTPADHSSL